MSTLLGSQVVEPLQGLEKHKQKGRKVGNQSGGGIQVALGCASDHRHLDSKIGKIPAKAKALCSC